MKKIFTLILIALMAFPVASTARKKLVILHLNDTHSHMEPIRGGVEDGLGGVIEIAAYTDSVRKAEGKRNVLLLHAGDFSQGTSYFTTLKGDIEIEWLNNMGFDASVVGNHEFDNGLDELARRASKLKCPLICSNYDFGDHALSKILKKYVIIKRGGYKIGIFGLAPNLSRVVDKSVSKNLTKKDDIEVANSIASYLKNEEKCDIVISLNHIGYEDEVFTDPELAAKTRNIDLIVGGHSHTFLDSIQYVSNLDGKKTPIVQDGCWGLNVGKIDIY